MKPRTDKVQGGATMQTIEPRGLWHTPFVFGSITMWLFFAFLFAIVQLMSAESSTRDATWINCGLWGMLCFCSLVGLSAMAEYRTALYQTEGSWRVAFGLLLLSHWVTVITPIHAIALTLAPPWATPTATLQSRFENNRARPLAERREKNAIDAQLASELLTYFRGSPGSQLVEQRRGWVQQLTDPEDVYRTQDGRVEFTYEEKQTKLGPTVLIWIQLDGGERLRLRPLRGRGRTNNWTTNAVRMLENAQSRAVDLQREATGLLAKDSKGAHRFGWERDWYVLLTESPAWTYSVSFEGSLLYRIFNALAALVTATLLAWTFSPFWKRFISWMRSGPIRLR